MAEKDKGGRPEEVNGTQTGFLSNARRPVKENASAGV